MKSRFAPVLLCALLPACATTTSTQNAASDHFRTLLTSHWDYVMTSHPEMATSVGYPGFDDRWTDMSLAAIERRMADTREYLARLETIDRDQLSPADQLDYDLFHENLTHQVASQRFPAELLAISQLGGVHQEIPQTLEIMPRRSVNDYELMLARLRRAPVLIAQHKALLELGIKQGVTQPSVVLRDVPELVLRQVPERAEDSPLMVAFREMPGGIPPDAQERLRNEAYRLYRETLRPAYLDFHEFVRQKYVPDARTTIALSALPDGAAWYKLSVEESTTTDLTPDEIHQLGLNEVARIRDEMQSVMAQVGFSGTTDEFLTFMREDPRFYLDSPTALVARYREIAARADREAPRFFARMPGLNYTVEPVPAYMEQSQPTAYYRRGSVETGRPGTFYVNTYDLQSRPTWGMEALALHEAVPGHHLQIALSQELRDVPEFRRWGGEMAFIEGWGLYAESLGIEMGFYTDPYARFGLLASEIWRAVRLVVDTGMHAKGWSRRDALAYFMANTGRPEHQAVVQIDRYIAWPGQALSYKVGALSIQRLRREAESALGPRFDLREFHNALLSEGALPLDILEARMRGWISARQGQ